MFHYMFRYVIVNFRWTLLEEPDDWSKLSHLITTVDFARSCMNSTMHYYQTPKNICLLFVRFRLPTHVRTHVLAQPRAAREKENSTLWMLFLSLPFVSYTIAIIRIPHYCNIFRVEHFQEIVTIVSILGVNSFSFFHKVSAWCGYSVTIRRWVYSKCQSGNL